MRVTFPRPADREMAYAVVERDDGVVYRLQGGRAGTALPHDIRHLIVERELGVTDGIWGGIAAGAAFNRDRVLRAELLADLVEKIAALDDPTPDAIRRLSVAKLPVVLRGPAPSPETLASAARAMQVEAARWARLRPGQELQYEWPSTQVRIPRQVRPPDSA
jgi:hypothetical protein